MYDRDRKRGEHSGVFISACPFFYCASIPVSLSVLGLQLLDQLHILLLCSLLGRALLSFGLPCSVFGFALDTNHLVSKNSQTDRGASFSNERVSVHVEGMDGTHGQVENAGLLGRCEIFAIADFVQGVQLGICQHGRSLCDEAFCWIDLELLVIAGGFGKALDLFCGGFEGGHFGEFGCD